MDLARVSALRELLGNTGWVERTQRFAGNLRRVRAGGDPGGLLLVGTPTEEPWHFAAHLDEEARWAGLDELAPTLVRWSPPPGAPAHLAVGLDRLERVRRGETVFVVAPDRPTAPLLERVSDARRTGATVFALDAGDDELAELAHEALIVPSDASASLVVPGAGLAAPNSTAPPVSFDVVTHLVGAAAADRAATQARSAGFRSRLARFLDMVSGPAGDDDHGYA